MILDTTKTFKTNNSIYSAFAAACKLQGIPVHIRINDLINEDVKKSGIMIPGIDNQERTSA